MWHFQKSWTIFQKFWKWKNHVTSCFPHWEKCKILKKLASFWKFLGFVVNRKSTSLSKLMYKYLTSILGTCGQCWWTTYYHLSLTKCGNNLCTPLPICQVLYFLVCPLSTIVCKFLPLFLVGFFWLLIQVLYSYKVLLSFNLQPKCPTIIYICSPLPPLSIFRKSIRLNNKLGTSASLIKYYCKTGLAEYDIACIDRLSWHGPA
jgi:hypothetical protein